jgi:hypothetical protein
MRYYRIALSDPVTNAPIIPWSLTGANPPFTSITSMYPDGSGTNPAALDIELDITQYVGNIADTASYVTIYGLGLQDLATSFNLGMGPTQGAPGVNISISAGMAKGLPLANAQQPQQGLLVQGKVLQAFGNWLGTDQTVSLFLNPLSQPLNFNFNWYAGTPLSTAISNVLSTAMPGFQQNIQIQQRTLPHNEHGTYQSFPEFADYIKGITGQNGSPVNMAVNANNVIVVWDGTQVPSGQPKPKQINFWDLIGQVTWIAPFQVTAKLVMRGDLNVLDIVQFPQGLASTTGAALLRLSDNSIFNGQFQIVRIQHWGRYRQPDAASWCTVIWCTMPVTPGQAPYSAAATGTSLTAIPGTAGPGP